MVWPAERTTLESPDRLRIMIVDCFTHMWETQAQLGRCVLSTSSASSLGRNPGARMTPAGAARHVASAQPVQATIVLGFKSAFMEAHIPNEFVAEHVRNHSDRLVGFAGIDPSNPKDAIADLRYARDQLGMRGLSIAPAAQNFHPSSSHAMRVYAEAAESGMPIVFHSGLQMTPQTRLEFANPVLLDEVARELPQLRIVIAHLGYPWVAETLCMLSKHAHVYAEVSWLVHQPWQAYQALAAAMEVGVIDKLLFGSGFPNGMAVHAIEALYGINHLCQGTNLPTIPREYLRGIVERETLRLLGLPSLTNNPPSSQSAGSDADEFE